MLSGLRMETGESVGVRLLDKQRRIFIKDTIIALFIACIPVIACLGPLIYFLVDSRDGSLKIGAIVLIIITGSFLLIPLIMCCTLPFPLRQMSRLRRKALASPSVSWRLDADEWAKSVLILL